MNLGEFCSVFVNVISTTTLDKFASYGERDICCGARYLQIDIFFRQFRFGKPRTIRICMWLKRKNVFLLTMSTYKQTPNNPVVFFFLQVEDLIM